MWIKFQVMNSGFRFIADIHIKDSKVDDIRGILIGGPDGCLTGMPLWAAKKLVNMDVICQHAVVAAERYLKAN